MRVAQRIQQQWAKKGAEISLDQQKITFKKEPVKPKKTLAQRVAASKAAWMGGLKALTKLTDKGKKVKS